MKGRKPSSETSREAFSKVVQAIIPDMPLVMHGGGDVQPSAVDPQAVQVLSELTANYIASLVGAAVDTHDMLNGGVPQALPPPPLLKARKTVTPRPYEPEGSISAAPTTPVTKIPEVPDRKRRRRTTDEFWDEPLPQPKIKNKPTKARETAGPKFEGVPVDEWVGVSGVDFFETHRARTAHIAMPAAIGAQSFIFPVCHDVGLYGKVRDIQAARRSLAPLLADPVIQEVVRNESHLQGPGALRKREKGGTADGGEDAEDPEDTDSEDEEGGAAWPGLDSLLPVHMTGDFRHLL